MQWNTSRTKRVHICNKCVCCFFPSYRPRFLVWDFWDSQSSHPAGRGSRANINNQVFHNASIAVVIWRELLAWKVHACLYKKCSTSVSSASNISCIGTTHLHSVGNT
eukprot:842229-Amphidinium_carterae.2